MDRTARFSRRWPSKTAALAWHISTLALFVLATGVAYGTAIEIRHLTRAVPAQPREVVQDVVIKNVGDASGRRASFRILLLTDEFRWRMSSSQMLEHTGPGFAFSPEMKAVLNDAREIICVGASSEELPVGVAGMPGRSYEERRAARRAEQIAKWVSAALSRPIPVRKLNAGHHVPTGAASDTSDQRRVVIILVLEREEHTNLDQALRDAMLRERTRAPIFETLLTKYSLAARSEFEWVD